MADCSALTASFKYDALNRRIEKKVNGKTTQYLYDGHDIIQEMEGGAVRADYIRTMNIDEPLAKVTNDGMIRYYHQDHLGSVIALSDENGTVKTRYAYSPFGETTITGEASDQPFQYTGRENDGTGYYYYRARYYSLMMRRFISADPIGFAGGDVNLYAYVGGNPVNWVDPWGLASIYELRPQLDPGDSSKPYYSIPYPNGIPSPQPSFCEGHPNLCGFGEEFANKSAEFQQCMAEELASPDPDIFDIMEVGGAGASDYYNRKAENHIFKRGLKQPNKSSIVRGYQANSKMAGRVGVGAVMVDFSIAAAKCAKKINQCDKNK